MRMRKKTIALLLSAAMIAGNAGSVMGGDSVRSAETESYKEDNSVVIAAHPELAKYLREDGSIDYVAMDMDLLPELQDAGESSDSDDASSDVGVNSDKDDDENTYTYDAATGKVTATGDDYIKRDTLAAAIRNALNGGDEDEDDEILNKYVKILYAGKDIEGFYQDIFKRNGDALTEVYVEDKNDLDQIGRGAFKQNPNLKKLYVGTPKNDVKGYEISHKAFYLDTSLTDVTLNAAFHVGQRAFYGDTGISSITFTRLHHMRGDAFQGCTGLEEFKLGAESNYFYTDEGMLYKKYCPYYVEQGGLYNIVVPGLMCVPYKKVGETFTVKRGTKTVAFGSVAGMDQMKTAKITAGVQIIGPRAFYEAPNMKTLYISKSVKHIGNEAFSIFDRSYEGSNPAPYADYDDVPYATEEDYDEAFGGKYEGKPEIEDGSVSCGNITDIYYSGSEEEWKQIKYDRYDSSANEYEDAGTVAEHLESVGLSSNVVIHYNSTDPDILVPDFVESNGVIKSYGAVMTAGSRKITFDSSFFGFTPTSYEVKALEKSPSNGVKINSKKGLLAGRKAGSYEVTLKGDGKEALVRVFVEKPVMKKLKVSETGNVSISQMLSGITYLEPTKYESKKTSVATIDDNGIISIKSQGTSKITVYFGSKKYKAGVAYKPKKEKQKKNKE